MQDIIATAFMAKAELDKLSKRFWSKVDKGDDDDCWPWLAGGTGSERYGYFWYNGRMVRAHRFVYALLHGPITDDVYVLHLCDNRLCCNPKHLVVGSQADNIQDMEMKGRGLAYGRQRRHV